MERFMDNQKLLEDLSTRELRKIFRLSSVRMALETLKTRLTTTGIDESGDIAHHVPESMAGLFRPHEE